MEFEGIFVPHTTPFKRDGSLDLEALRACVDFWVGSGLHGLVVLGSNGEFPYLTCEEKREVIRAVVPRRPRPRRRGLSSPTEEALLSVRMPRANMKARRHGAPRNGRRNLF